MPLEQKRVPQAVKRREAVKVMFSLSELEELRTAADHASMGLSVFLRVMALEAARKRETKAA